LSSAQGEKISAIVNEGDSVACVLIVFLLGICFAYWFQGEGGSRVGLWLLQCFHENNNKKARGRKTFRGP